MANVNTPAGEGQDLPFGGTDAPASAASDPLGIDGS